MTPVVQASGICVDHGPRRALHDVDLVVPGGQVLAILGPNGSGKSTLVRALVGVLPLASGTVRLLGAPLGRGVPWERIGYVPQRVSAASGVTATAQEVVLAGLLHGRRLRPPRDGRARVQEALELVGLGDRVHRPVREMSGGQQQRVLIARALVRRPELLLLDEPVAGVDLPSRQTFASVLAGLDGMTVLVVLHELGAFAPLIDRAVVLRDGRVVHDGAPPPGLPDHDHVHPHGPDEHEPGTAPVLRITP